MNLPSFACGTATAAQDGYTLDTGLGGDVDFVAIAGVTDDIVVTVRSQTNGVITLGQYVAGAADGSDRTLYWFAFLRKGATTSGDDTRHVTSMPHIAFGTAVKSNGETLQPFLGRRDAVIFVANGSTNDTVVVVNSQANGTVTLGVHTAGSAATDETIHWMAISTKSGDDPEGSAAADRIIETGIPGLACGVAETADGETIDTGLARTVAFVGVAETNDTIVIASSQSNGVITCALDTAGVAAAGTETVHWIAFHDTVK